MARTYTKKERARAEEETRRRIVEAAIELHQAKGVAATSMRDVAARAGVGAVTVYRHFPDIGALVGACSGSYFERHPMPDAEAWAATADSAERLRHALAETYGYHRETAPMMRSVLSELRGSPLAAGYEAYWARALEVLVQGWPGDEAERRLVRAGLELALRFETWAVLTDAGLDDDQAAEVAARLAQRC